MNSTQPQPIIMDPLVDYMKDFVQNAPPIPESVMEGVSFVDGFALIVLDRRGPFQAQLTLCRPGAEIVDHGHPNVDSFVYYLTGEIYLRVGEVTVYKPEDIETLPDGACSHRGRMLRIVPGQKHGATIGPNGGAFITFQMWLDGKPPRSVEEDWDGPALSEEHAMKLRVKYEPSRKVVLPIGLCRELEPNEVHLCVEGGKSFFDEGKMPGGFDPDYFCNKWAGMIKDGTAVIIGAFDGETITGAIGAVVSRGMFSPAKFAIEGFWYVLPAYRNGRHGLHLLKSFELWGDHHGVDFYALIHLVNLQPERLGGLYEKLGYRKVETHYVKEAK